MGFANWFRCVFLAPDIYCDARYIAIYHPKSVLKCDVFTFDDERLFIEYDKYRLTIVLKLGEERIVVLNGDEGLSINVKSYRHGCWVKYLKTFVPLAMRERSRLNYKAKQEEAQKWSPVDDCSRIHVK